MTSDGEQYFTAEPSSEHSYKKIPYEIQEQKFTFTTDSGVFSRSAIDFGTDNLIEEFINQDKGVIDGKVLDLGTGYGVVGTVINKITGREVDMVDVNERALELAKQNLSDNGAKGNVFQSDVYSNVTGKYAAIVVNPPVRAGKPVVTAMIVEAKDHLLPGGELFVVLQRKQGSPSAKKRMIETFGNFDVLSRNGGYNIMNSRNDS